MEESEIEFELKAPDPRLGLASISHIKTTLDRVFGKAEWYDLELETISLTFGILLDELTRDKISVLQCLEKSPDLFFDNAVFMLHATEVINNQVADFEFFPVPTSLELAYAIEEVKKVLRANDEPFLPTDAFKTTVSYLLREEGYSEPVATFDFVPKELLVAGQTKEDTADKEKAIKQYIKEMSK